MLDTAREALGQVKARQYAHGLKGYGCSKLLAYGMAFCGKSCATQVEPL